MDKIKRYNISEKHKSFLWIPPKTGSYHAVWVLDNFDFYYLEMTPDKKNIQKYIQRTEHSHQIALFDGHEKYKLICTARHPIKRVFSAFIYTSNNRKSNDLSKEAFIKFFIREFHGGESAWFEGLFFNERIPDYFLRTENLYEDYLKIPFVKDSELVKSGKLEEMCKEKKNSFERNDLKIAEYFTDDMIDSMYKKYKIYFDSLGYKPNLF